MDKIYLKIHWEEDGYEYLYQERMNDINFYVSTYSFEMHKEGWEHVCSTYHPDWQIDMLFRRKLPTPKISLFKKLITKFKI